jgi:hypothetical protein
VPDEVKKAALSGDELQQAVLEAVEKDQPFTLVLCKPIRTKEVDPVVDLTYRPPRGRDMRDLKFDTSNITDGELMKITSRLTGVQPALIDELCARDVKRSNIVAALFLSGGQ